MFSHLHLHSCYSFFDSTIKIDALMNHLVKMGHNACAITDHGHMIGVMRFYEACKKYGIKPIIGMEAYVCDELCNDSKTYHLVLLCRNNVGYQNLCKLSSIGYDNFYRKPRIKLEELKKYKEGLICLSACLGGELCKSNFDENVLKKYCNIFENNFYIEMQANLGGEQQIANAKLFELAKHNDIPYVITNDCHYLKPEDKKYRSKLMEMKGIQYEYIDDFCLDVCNENRISQMTEYPDALDFINQISTSCNVELNLTSSYTPRYTNDMDFCNDDEAFDSLISSRSKGLSSRYRERLENECRTIKDLRFSGYFLYLHQWINYAKRAGIAIGPGRGSGAGSLVAYVLGITDVDPIKYNLLFERFLNPERVSMPDIDVDVCKRRRHEVIGWLKNRWGEQNISQIMAVGYMRPKCVVKDVSRIFNVPYEKINTAISKFKFDCTLDSLLQVTKDIPELNGRVVEFEECCKELVDLPRQPGIHAGGVIISKVPISDIIPLYKNEDGLSVSQYDKDDVEKNGLIKFDILGLESLTVIDDCKKNANISKLPDNYEEDLTSLRMLASGDTLGVFQAESYGFTSMLRKMRPACFEDIIAAGALFRPGPLDAKLVGTDKTMVDLYIERKHGARVVYPHSMLEPILSKTYGIFIYQEQIMQAVQVLANYSLGRADVLRRAIGKKKPEIIEQEKVSFIDGCTKNGIPEDVASEIYAMIESFAGYGFNRSHACAYGLITMQTAWLKSHFPVHFMASYAQTLKDDPAKITRVVKWCEKNNIKISRPSLNKSTMNFQVFDYKILPNLCSIKGVGEKVAAEIMAKRPYTSLEDLFNKCDARIINKKIKKILQERYIL